MEVLFEEILRNSRSSFRFAHHMRCCVFDELFDPDEVKAKLNESSGSSSHQPTPVICLVCRKLGPAQQVAPEYTEAVKQVFRLGAFQGLASGDTATSAHYFLAANDSYAYYLDPHVEVRPALDGAEMDCSTWHAMKSRRTNCFRNEMGPAGFQ